MGDKKANYIELFIDKIILGVAGIIAVIILFIFVIRGPQIDGMGSSEIDDATSRKAQQLEESLKAEPNEKEIYKSKQTEYLAFLKESIKEINDRISFPLPGYQQYIPKSTRYVYKIPEIGKIAKPSSATVRMAAFVPTESLSPVLTYANAETKLEDLDLITVESSIDAKSLYGRFKEAFAGRTIPKDNRKDQYAKPVFAKVQLQKKTQKADGTWSDWADVSQTKICYLKNNLAIPEKPSEYAIEMALVQFAKNEFRDEILQPPVYVNALPTDHWISPTLYNQRQKRIAKEQEENRNRDAETERSRTLQDRSTTPAREARQSAPRTPDETAARPAREAAAPSRTGGRREPTRSTPTRKTTPERPAPSRSERPTPEERTIKTNLPGLIDNSEENNYNDIVLKPETNLENLDKLVFWAHDDTTQPGEKYQYRIRIGVFNPIAGRDWFSEEQKSLRDQVVLWSDYADVNDVIEIPQRLYFFATGIRENEKITGIEKTVDVEVAKYTLGNWVKRKYIVKCGDEIGGADEPPDPRLEQAGISSDSLDLSTGAVMIDARKTTEWYGTGVLKSQDYYELLYSRDANGIEKTPIKERFWPAKDSKIYKEIAAAIEALPVKLLSWNEAANSQTQRSVPQQQQTPAQDETYQQPPMSPENAQPMP